MRYIKQRGHPLHRDFLVNEGSALEPVRFSPLKDCILTTFHLIMTFSSLIWGCFYFLTVLAPHSLADSEDTSTQNSAALHDRARRILSENPLIGGQSYATV